MLRSLRTLAAVSLMTLGFASSAFAADKFEIDPGHSGVTFMTTHLGVGAFQGRFNDISGSYMLDTADFSKSSIKLEVKAESVDTLDKKRDDHLRGPDFFNTKQFPKIAFESTSVTKNADGTLKIAGKLSFHGVTKDVSFNAKFIGEGKDPWGGYRSGFYGELVVKRSDFGVNFMPGGIGEEVTLRISIEGVKK